MISGTTTRGSGVPGGGQCTRAEAEVVVRADEGAEERRLARDEHRHPPDRDARPGDARHRAVTSVARLGRVRDERSGTPPAT